jgi:hypothetical protein
MTMTKLPDEGALALEFDVFARRAGLEIADDRKPAVFAGFMDLRRMRLRRSVRRASLRALYRGQRR